MHRGRNSDVHQPSEEKLSISRQRTTPPGEPPAGKRVESGRGERRDWGVQGAVLSLLPALEAACGYSMPKICHMVLALSPPAKSLQEMHVCPTKDRQKASQRGSNTGNHSSPEIRGQQRLLPGAPASCCCRRTTLSCRPHSSSTVNPENETLGGTKADAAVSAWKSASFPPWLMLL